MMKPAGAAGIGTVLGLCVLLAAAGCRSSPPTSYYRLETLPRTYGESATGSPMLLLGPLHLPDYLDRREMVLRASDAEMKVEEFHQWAEPLDSALPRVVAANVGGMVRGLSVVTFPVHTAFRPDYRVLGQIERFDASTDGRAVLIVQWSLLGPEHEVMTGPRTSRYVVQARDPGDPGAVAQALSAALGRFSRDVALELHRTAGTELKAPSSLRAARSRRR